MIRCCLLLILISSTTALTSCTACHYYSAVEGAENCNMNPSLAREWPSPDGTRKAVEQHFDCPGWYALKVEITNPDQTKAVIFDDRPVDQVRPARWPELKVEWKSDRELWITYPPRQDTTCTSNAAGVAVHCIDGAVAR